MTPDCRTILCVPLWDKECMVTVAEGNDLSGSFILRRKSVKTETDLQLLLDMNGLRERGSGQILPVGTKGWIRIFNNMSDGT